MQKLLSLIIGTLICCQTNAQQVKSIKPFPILEEPLVFHKLKAKYEGDVYVASIFYKDFVAQKEDEVTQYDKREHDSDLMFYSRLTRKNPVKRQRSEFFTSDDAVAVEKWPFRYIVKSADITPNPLDDTYNPELRDYRPYKKNVLTDVRLFDASGNELDVISGAPTGRRVYQMGEMYYLGTISKPRRLLSIFQYRLCPLSLKDAASAQVLCYDKTRDPDGQLVHIQGIKIPLSQDVESKRYFSNRWVDGKDGGWMSNGGIKSSNVFWAYHTSPITPLILSDYALSQEGKVTKGKAMCVADCPKGLQFKLLKAGDVVPAVKP
jgi:hypothetical protein